MPATSRSGERFRRRSGSERAGSPSKSRIAQPRSGVSIVWPRWRSPWVRMTLPPAPMCESSCSALADVLAASGDRLDRPASRAARRTRARSARRPLAVSSDSDSVLGSSGANAGSTASEPSDRVQLAGDLAQRAHVLEQPVGIAWPARRARAPSRRGRRRGTPAGSRASRRPAGPRSRTSRPAARCCGNPRADRKRSSSSSGFSPGSTRRNAFRISSSPNTIEELDCSTPTGRTSTVPPSPDVRRRRPVEAERAVVDGHLGVRAHRGAAARARAPDRRARRRPSSPSAVRITRSSQPSASGRRPSGTW